MVLRAGYLTVALKIQEAATAMCHEDIRTRLSDALNDAFRGTGSWCYVVAVFGDDKSGDVVYSCSSDLKKATYTISATSCKIDTATAVDVAPLTTYEVQSDSLTEAGARNSKRDMVQLQTIHDSAAALGANCSMQEAAKPGEAAAQQAQGATTGMRLVESAATTEAIVLKEARADYEIKLIAPGKGSSAFYPKEVLQRDGPKVFKANTHVYVNHPTMAEEAARPEGDVKNLAGVLTTDAVYHESHVKGPGLYARMKVFADHGQMVEEKAPHVGMSIRASGIAEAGRKQEGVPVLKELTSAESVDVVTRAGAGGMILTEAAKPANPIQEAASMTAEEVQRLVEAGIRTSRLPEDARQEATRLLETVALKNETKAYIVETVLRGTIPTKEGALDKDALAPLVVAEAQRVGKLIAAESGGAQVRGMGIGAPIPAPKPEEIAAREAASKRELEEDLEIWQSLGLTENAAKHAAKGRAA
jgi:hypothetical protein